MTLRYWYSTPKWTVQVNADERDIVTWTAPILKLFIGQPRDRIRRWCAALKLPLAVEML